MEKENINKWCYLPTMMYFANLKEAKLVLGTNRSRRLRHEGKLILITE